MKSKVEAKMLIDRPVAERLAFDVYVRGLRQCSSRLRLNQPSQILITFFTHMNV